MNAPSPATRPEGAAAPEKTHVAREFAHTSPLVACRFDPRGRFVFATAEDCTVRRWDLAPGKGAAIALAGHDSWVFALGFHPEGETLLTGGGDGQLVWWPAAAAKPEPFRRVQAHQGWIRALDVSPDGTTIATCGNDRVIRLWSFADGAPLMELHGHERPVYRVLFTPDGRNLISGDLLGRVTVWDHRPGKEGRRLDAGKLHRYDPSFFADYGGVRALAISRDGTQVACGGLTDVTNAFAGECRPAALVYDWRTGREPQLFQPKEDIKGMIWGLRFHPDGFLIAATGGQGGGFLWFWKSGQANEFFKFALPNTARDMDLLPDGLHVATAHHDGKVRLSLLRAKPT